MSWSRIISISFSLMCLLEKLQNVRGNKADFWNHCTCSQNHSIAIVFNSCMTVIYRLLLWKLRSKMRLVELQLATFSLPQFHKCFFLYYRDKRSWTSEVLCATLHFFLITDLCFLQTLTQQRPKYSPLRTRKWLQSTLWCDPLRQYKESTAEWSWPIMDSNVCFIIFAMPWVFIIFFKQNSLSTFTVHNTVWWSTWITSSWQRQIQVLHQTQQKWEEREADRKSFLVKVLSCDLTN